MFWGAMSWNAFMDELKAAPASLWAQSGFSKAQIIDLVLQVYSADLDLDGDGVAESLSFAYAFAAEVSPKIAGLY
jgi:hypothetical protein